MLSINAPLAERIRYAMHMVTADELLQYIDDHEALLNLLAKFEIDVEDLESIESDLQEKQDSANKVMIERDKLREAIDAVIERLGEIE